MGEIEEGEGGIGVRGADKGGAGARRRRRRKRVGKAGKRDIKVQSRSRPCMSSDGAALSPDARFGRRVWEGNGGGVVVTGRSQAISQRAFLSDAASDSCVWPLRFFSFRDEYFIGGLDRLVSREFLCGYVHMRSPTHVHTEIHSSTHGKNTCTFTHSHIYVFTHTRTYKQAHTQLYMYTQK